MLHGRSSSLIGDGGIGDSVGCFLVRDIKLLVADIFLHFFCILFIADFSFSTSFFHDLYIIIR